MWVNYSSNDREGSDIRPPRIIQGRADRCQKSLNQTLAPHGTEAIAAINRLIAPGQEGHLGVDSTLGTHRGVHLPLATAEASTATASATATAVSSALVPAG